MFIYIVASLHYTNYTNIGIYETRILQLMFIYIYNNYLKAVEQGQEGFEDTKGEIGIRISKKNRQHNDQQKKYKGQTTIYITHIKN